MPPVCVRVCVFLFVLFKKTGFCTVAFRLWIDFRHVTSGGFYHLSSFEVKHLVYCLALNTTHNTRFLPNRVPCAGALDSEEMAAYSREAAYLL